MDKLNFIANKLRLELSDDPNVIAVGSGQNIIYIYLSKKAGKYPSKYEGFEVKVKRMGKIKY